MANIITARISVRGVRPLLWHKFGPDAIPLEKQERTGVAGNDPEEWKRTVTFDSGTRQLWLDPTYAFSCLRDAARHTKKGKGSIQSAVSATLQVADDRIMVDRFLPAEDDITTDPAQSVYIDVRGVRNPSTKARNIRYRVAAKAGWETSFTVHFDKTVVARDLIHTVVIDAGKLVGLGNGRTIGFGRFEVQEFEIAEA